MNETDLGDAAGAEPWRPPYLGCLLLAVLALVLGRYALESESSHARNGAQVFHHEELGEVLSLRFSVQGALFAVDEKGQPWRIRDGVLSQPIAVPDRGPFVGASATSGATVLAKQGGGLTVLNLRSGEALDLDNRGAPLSLSAIAPGGEALSSLLNVAYASASVTSDTVFFAAGGGGAEDWTQAEERGGCRSLALSQDLLAVGAARGQVTLLERRTGERLRTLRASGDQEAVEALAFSPDGTLVAAARRASLVVWSVGDGKQIFSSGVEGAPLTTVSLSDGSLVAVGDLAGQLRVFDCKDPAIAGRSFPHDEGERSGGVRAIAFFSSQVAWAVGGRIFLYDLASDR